MPKFGKKKKDKNEQPESAPNRDVDNEDGSSLENVGDNENNDLNDLLGGADIDREDDGADEGDGGSGDPLSGLGMDEDEADGDDDMDSDLMDIFSSEAEDVDMDLVALTQGLEPVDASSLLIQAQAIVSSLRKALYGNG